MTTGRQQQIPGSLFKWKRASDITLPQTQSCLPRWYHIMKTWKRWPLWFGKDIVIASVIITAIVIMILLIVIMLWLVSYISYYDGQGCRSLFPSHPIPLIWNNPVLGSQIVGLTPYWTVHSGAVSYEWGKGWCFVDVDVFHSPHQ
jgi:hypothetical protein